MTSQPLKPKPSYSPFWKPDFEGSPRSALLLAALAEAAAAFPKLPQNLNGFWAWRLDSPGRVQGFVLGFESSGFRVFAFFFWVWVVLATFGALEK